MPTYQDRAESLFADDSNGEPLATEPAVKETIQNDSAFESKVESWRSFIGAKADEKNQEEKTQEERNESTKKFEEDLLNHPVVDTTMAQSRGEIAKRRFWEAEVELTNSETVCKKSVLSGLQCSSTAKECSVSTNENKNPSAVLKDSIITEDKRVFNKVAVHDTEEQEPLQKTISEVVDTSKPQQEFISVAQVKKAKYMNGTIPIDPTGEIVQNLENKIKLLNLQLLNLKVTINERENTIKFLRSQLELLKPQEANSDVVKECVERGLAVLNEIKLIEKPVDQSKEMNALRLENMSLKNIIGELAMREDQRKNQGI